MNSSDCQTIKARISNLQNLIASNTILVLRDKRIQSQIDVWKKQLVSLKSEYETNGCDAKINDLRIQEVKNIGGAYKELDQKRIEEEATYQRNKRILFGALVLLFALVIVIPNKKSE